MTTQDTTALHDEFEDIRPYNDNELPEKMAKIVKEPGFEHAIRYVMPDVDYPEFVKGLLSVKTRDEFQRKIVGAFLELLVAKTTKGLSFSGNENYTPGMAYVFITNHRDIVLDAAFLNLCFIHNNIPIAQVAIGNNLLIYDWITDLVKLNGSFIVKRDTGVREALFAAKHLSAYIHNIITNDKSSAWIAQREGRAKDSNDLTQESVIKMLCLGGNGNPLENILELNLMPVSISYEFDPNDYLKVREFLLKRRDPEFKKSQRDDLFSMETGILKQKGHVHFHLGKCINSGMVNIDPTNRAEVIRRACDLLDNAIHAGYKIYPCNYIAFDKLNGNNDFSDKYTDADVASFNEYISHQLAKVDVPDITDEEQDYMLEMMLLMYANPLKNQQASA